MLIREQWGILAIFIVKVCNNVLLWYTGWDMLGQRSPGLMRMFFLVMTLLTIHVAVNYTSSAPTTVQAPNPHGMMLTDKNN